MMRLFPSLRVSLTKTKPCVTVTPFYHTSIELEHKQRTFVRSDKKKERNWTERPRFISSFLPRNNLHLGRRHFLRGILFWPSQDLISKERMKESNIVARFWTYILLKLNINKLSHKKNDSLTVLLIAKTITYFLAEPWKKWQIHVPHTWA